MIKAILRNGVIVPQEPLPCDWQEGEAVAVELVSKCQGLDTPEIIAEKRHRASKAVRDMVRHWAKEGFELPHNSPLRNLLDEKEPVTL